VIYSRVEVPDSLPPEREERALNGCIYTGSHDHDSIEKTSVPCNRYGLAIR
jgi:hypothetical protein